MFLKNIGAPELLLVLVIVVLIFGVGKVGDLGAALGKSIREFRREVGAPDEETQTEEDTDAAADE